MARQRGNTWTADARVGDQRIRRAFKTKEEAEAFEQMERKRAFQTENTVGNVFPALRDKIWADAKDYSGAKQITAELILRLGPDTEVFRIDDETVEALIEEWEDEGYSNQTINNKLSKLSKILKWAKRKNLIARMPFIDRKAQGGRRTRWLTEEEEARLFKALNVEDRVFSTFLLYTGCRKGEALKLEWKDWNDMFVEFWDTKNGDNRSVPQTEQVRQCRAWIKENMPGAERPFSWVSYSGYIKRWRDVKDATGFSDDSQVIPHVLRHTCATRLVRRKVDIRRVKEWMGHKSLETTLRYAKLAKHDLDEVAEILGQKTSALF